MRLCLLCFISWLVLLETSCSKSSVEESDPFITDVSPITAGNGETITIRGKGFASLADSAGCVKINFRNKQVCAIVLSDTLAEVQVPFEAGDGYVCVMYKNKQICSPQPFNYIPGNPGSNSYMRLADCPGLPSALTATDNAILAGFINWWKYDISSNSWSAMPAPPEVVIYPSSFTYNGNAYLFGGTNRAGVFQNKLQCYNAASNNWSLKAALPGSGRKYAAVFVWNDKIYIAGGRNSDSYGGNTVAKELWQYDPVTDQWLRKTDLPFGAEEGCYAVHIGNKFYIPTTSMYGTHEYDPTTDTWRFFNDNFFIPNAVPYSDKNFALGYTIGGGSMGQATGIVRRYAINYLGIPIGEDYAQAPVGGYLNIMKAFGAVINNELYYGMGYNLSGGVAVQSTQFWRYRY